MQATRFLKSSLLLSALIASLSITGAANANEEKPSNNVPLNELRQFSEVFHQIRENYVSEVSDEDLIRLAIEGMLQGLDPHSTFLDQKDFNEVREFAKGEFAGIGIEVMMESGLIKVVAPIDDTPAQKAGILSGDIIIKIDDNAVQGGDLDSNIDLLRGKPGSEVNISILREEKAAPMQFKIKREIIKVKSVKSRWLSPGFAYLRIAQFQKNTAEQAKEQLLALFKENSAKGLIIDLRNNPGGILQAAVGICDLFLNEGLIVYTEGRTERSHEKHHATADGLFPEKPIVILMNQGSASASEIVAGALQDQRRAIIAGTRSFGKGSVQTILPLPNGNGIKMTTARYYTPNGRSIQAQGIEPDIIIGAAKITSLETQKRISEANLVKHLENTNEKNKPKNKDKADNHPELISSDYQLHEAYNLLKVMALSNKYSQYNKAQNTAE